MRIGLRQLAHRQREDGGADRRGDRDDLPAAATPIASVTARPKNAPRIAPRSPTPRSSRRGAPATPPEARQARARVQTTPRRAGRRTRGAASPSWSSRRTPGSAPARAALPRRSRARIGDQDDHPAGATGAIAARAPSSAGRPPPLEAIRAAAASSSANAPPRPTLLRGSADHVTERTASMANAAASAYGTAERSGAHAPRTGVRDGEGDEREAGPAELATCRQPIQDRARGEHRAEH